MLSYTLTMHDYSAIHHASSFTMAYDICRTTWCVHQHHVFSHDVWLRFTHIARSLWNPKHLTLSWVSWSYHNNHMYSHADCTCLKIIKFFLHVYNRSDCVGKPIFPHHLHHCHFRYTCIIRWGHIYLVSWKHWTAYGFLPTYNLMQVQLKTGMRNFKKFALFPTPSFPVSSVWRKKCLIIIKFFVHDLNSFIVYIIEIILRVIGHGPYGYFRKKRNMWVDWWSTALQ